MDCFVRPIYDLLFPPGKSGEGATTPLFDTPTTPHPSREAAEKAKQEAEAEERERMQLLVSSFTEEKWAAADARHGYGVSFNENTYEEKKAAALHFLREHCKAMMRTSEAS